MNFENVYGHVWPNKRTQNRTHFRKHALYALRGILLCFWNEEEYSGPRRILPQRCS